MKLYHSFLLVAIVIFSCNEKSEKTNPVSEENKSQLTIAETIAYKNGFKEFEQIEQIDFTFNVDRGESHFERSWQWRPKTNHVTYIKEADTIAFNRATMDSTTMQYDNAFINDKYWLLAPFNLVWDKGVAFSEPRKEIAPISGIETNVLTITYGDEGGYTPGDAYDLYYGANFMLQEWVFRKGNNPAPSMTTTWEEYKDFKGVKIATMHKDSIGAFKLYFTGINVH